jgi:vancomycin permeability regulator SanA
VTDDAPRPRRRRRLVATVAAALVLLVAAPVLWVQAVGQSRVRDADHVPDRPVALVLAGLRPDGSPSTYLRRRLEEARRLYADGTVRVLLVSGDSTTAWHDEPTAMRDWLVDHGVPDAAVVEDYAGVDTHDTCVRAHDVFGVTGAVVVTQDYHLRRALFSCTAAGIDVVGVGVSSRSVEPAKALMYRVRELPASGRAAVDAVVHRSPRFGGPAETGVADALAAQD